MNILRFTPENEARFNGLKAEFDELGASIKSLSSKLNSMDTVPRELNDAVRNMSRRNSKL